MAKAGSDYVVIIDGKEAYRSPLGTNSTIANGGFPSIRFTPNSKHLFSVTEAQFFKVFLDGKEVYQFDGAGREPMTGPGGWDMGPDGTLTLACFSQDGLKRVRITPGNNDGFAAWAATAKDVKR